MLYSLMNRLCKIKINISNYIKRESGKAILHEPGFIDRVLLFSQHPPEAKPGQSLGLAMIAVAGLMILRLKVRMLEHNEKNDGKDCKADFLFSPNSAKRNSP
ncbi:MAG: hypothetical protein OXF73_00275 [Gammaproteobacteria bacterium]|nr:hypothetical protein [Gammaproteobacteria bacterium]MCY4228479.1 hypothetical protein [Gammaproteobacteria bacterium]